MILSYTMRRSLERIIAGGGLAIPEGGGWWKGLNGRRLQFKVDNEGDYMPIKDVVTLTIFALHKRGYLEPVSAGPRHQVSYRITRAAEEMLDRI